MSFCKNRIMDICKKTKKACIFSEDCFEPEERKRMTNADRIRDMSDEELAELLEGDFGNMATGTALHWLKQPAEEESHG